MIMLLSLTLIFIDKFNHYNFKMSSAPGQSLKKIIFSDIHQGRKQIKHSAQFQGVSVL